MSPTSLPYVPVHLSPFAMWPAFPAADYYEDSVALGLAPGRRSRISPMSYVRARFRSSTHPYARDLSPGIPSCGLAGPETRRSGTRWPHESACGLRPVARGLNYAPIGIGLQAV